MLRCCSQRRRLRSFLLRRTRSGKVELGAKVQRLALVEGDDGRDGSLILPTRRGLHLLGGFGLRLRRPRVDRLGNRSERLRIETGSELIALLGCLRVPAAGGESKPPVRFGEVLLNANAASVKDGEIVLAVRHTIASRLVKPTRGSLIIRTPSPFS